MIVLCAVWWSADKMVAGSDKVSLSTVQRASLVRTGTIRQLCDWQRSSCLLRGRTEGYERRRRPGWSEQNYICERLTISEVTLMSSLITLCYINCVYVWKNELCWWCDQALVSDVSVDGCKAQTGCLQLLEILEIYWNLKTLLEILEISWNLLDLLEIFV